MKKKKLKLISKIDIIIILLGLLFFEWIMVPNIYQNIGGLCYENAIDVSHIHNIGVIISCVSLIVCIILTIVIKKLSKAYIISMIVILCLFTFLIPMGIHGYAQKIYKDSIKGDKPIPCNLVGISNNN